MGILMMAFARCQATATVNLIDDDEEPMLRQSRGLVLRSWRSANLQGDQPAGLPSQKVLAEQHREPPLLYGLPFSMKFALLQRLAGHDKRTPNSKAFLGMRGKKSWNDETNLLGDISSSAEGDLYDHVPEKKKINGERFLGMRGKKADDDGTAGLLHERFVFQQQPFQQQGISKKRAPSSNSFMGMRGKRSAWTMMPIDYDYQLPNEQDAVAEETGSSEIPPSSAERFSR